MTGSEDTPTLAASAIESCAPSRTTEHCKTKVLAHFTPGAKLAPSLTTIAMTVPMTAGNRAADQRHVLPYDARRHCRDGKHREPGGDGLRAAGSTAQAGGVAGNKGPSEKLVSHVRCSRFAGAGEIVGQS